MNRIRVSHRRLSRFVLVGLLITTTAMAAPRLPGFFTDNMVLQREMEVPVWGWADPGEVVTVAFGGQSVSATAGANGKWMVKLAAMPASGEGRVLKASSKSGQPVALANVVVGEVWICSGQSNMEWTMSGIKNSKEEIVAATFPLIRHMKVGHVATDVPLADLKSEWQVCSPSTAGGFTAVGYFFARKLHAELAIPIGLIGSNWGGTRVEPWTPPVGFRAIPELSDISARVDATLPGTAVGKAAYETLIAKVDTWSAEAKTKVAEGQCPPPLPTPPRVGGSHQDPTRIYNAMIHPLIPYAIRGAIWYQGESNGGEGVSYFHKKQALIGGWRKLWNQGAFPFYFVQLANFKQATDAPAGGDGWAKTREAQSQCLTIPNVGMAVITDIGEAKDIHPRNKQDVGLRLALWALAKDYGQKDRVYSGPLYKSHTIKDGAIRVTFDHAGSGLIVGKKEGLAPTTEDSAGTLTRFAIAGADKQWHWADAVIDGNSVVLSSANVAEPVAARYAFSMNPEGANLYNREGLPASPFRTDDW
ncbi:MAG: sialate O-acetylesterase [Kiritimatiellia bacterium]|jgi:sialate O-acetylesterase|nr:sialate O-acetylesterase [Kiritimatiellia bacterium]MDP6809492.1 sialate O-acetylesterase [Kiritimatiellia bacterium]MDP7023831.1 sialate O-acetylesterase [Kiritimatiellia bacterium]